MAKKKTPKKSPARTTRPGKRPAKRPRKSAKRPAAGKATKKKAAARPARGRGRDIDDGGMPPVVQPSGDRRQKRRPTELVTQASAVQARMMSARAKGLTIGLVPTMGALHAGHAALLEEARRRADIVVASVFVNPKQFAPGEDLARYPRTLDDDVRLCASCGVDIVFAPGAEEIYPAGFDTAVKAGALGDELEGAARAGHFDGVLTVVLTLFHIAQPHFAVFGEKDYQQLLLVRRMVRDLKMTVEVVPMPVIRDVDGLALSSRNASLSAEDRRRALSLSKALMAAQDEAQRGVVEAERFVRAARGVLDEVPGLEVDYVEVRDPRTLEPIEKLEQSARLLLAARVGGVRLIDNGPLFAGVRYP
jgi:pantoate--beta-alanine ligase